MNRISIYMLFCFVVVGASQAFGACTPTEIEHRTFRGLDAETNGIKFALGAKNVTFAITVKNGSWTATELQFKQITEFISKNSTEVARVGMFQLVDGVAGPVGSDAAVVDSKLLVCTSGPEAAVADASSPIPPPVEPATPEECRKVRSALAREHFGGSSFVSTILFNSAGVHCYSPPVVRTGDLLAVGLVLKPGEHRPATVSVDYTGCPVESAAPEILANGEMPQPQAGTILTDAQLRASPTVELLDARPCGGETPVVTLKIGAGETATTTPYSLNQYKRYRAAFHMGALYTDLHDPTFGLLDDAGTNVIANTDAEKRGPEYVAALVVQGIFNYRPFKKSDPNDPLTWQYKGRDPIYDNGFVDRIGLVLTTGLKDPGNRFGIGLSYEVAYGVNIIGIYEVAKVKQLRGLELGDPFTGEADAIPTRKEWEKKFSIGLTFDLAFASKLFSGAKSGG